ncbi:unnamed protein product [Closterium sp. NIES-65]|nr:unnamed protein product [Closterium sp. NIES-65]
MSPVLQRHSRVIQNLRKRAAGSTSPLTAARHPRGKARLDNTPPKGADSEEVGGAAMDVDMDVAEMGLDAGDPHPLEKLADSDFFNKFEDDFEDEDLA